MLYTGHRVMSGVWWGSMLSHIMLEKYFCCIFVSAFLCIAWMRIVAMVDGWMVMFTVEGTEPSCRPRKTWWYDSVEEDIKRFDLSQEDAQSWRKCRRKIEGYPANPGSPGI